MGHLSLMALCLPEATLPLSLTGSGQVFQTSPILAQPYGVKKQRWRGRAEDLVSGSSDFHCSRSGLRLPFTPPRPLLGASGLVLVLVFVFTCKLRWLLEGASQPCLPLTLQCLRKALFPPGLLLACPTCPAAS